MENPLYSGQSMLPPGGWWELFCLLSANGWFVFFFLSILASCLGTSVILWPPPTPPFSFFIPLLSG